MKWVCMCMCKGKGKGKGDSPALQLASSSASAALAAAAAFSSFSSPFLAMALSLGEILGAIFPLRAVSTGYFLSVSFKSIEWGQVDNQIFTNVMNEKRDICSVMVVLRGIEPSAVSHELCPISAVFPACPGMLWGELEAVLSYLTLRELRSGLAGVCRVCLFIYICV